MFDLDELPLWLSKFIETALNAFDGGGRGRAGWKARPALHKISWDRETRHKEARYQDYWEVWLFPSAVELVGGRDDGRKVLPFPRLVDLKWILNSLKETTKVVWSHDARETTEVLVEGVVSGCRLWIHILEEPPADQPASMTFEVLTGISDQMDLDSSTQEDDEPEILDV